MNVASAYYGLHGTLSLIQNLKVYAKIYGVKKPVEKSLELLKTFGLIHMKDKRAEVLSSGERPRLSLCKGLINDPKLLLLDEATVGLDPDVAVHTRQILRDYHKESNCSVLFTSHYMAEVEQLCNRIGFIHDGKIVKIDSAKRLKNLIKTQIVNMDFHKTSKRLFDYFNDQDIQVISKNKNQVSFEIDSKGDRVYKIINSLFQRGFKIKHLDLKRPTLDDIFIKIAGKK